MPARSFRPTLVALVLSGLLLTACGEATTAQQAGPAQAIPVDVVTLHPVTLPLTSELTGRTSAYRIAEVRPQVGGILKKRLFTEGAHVKAGQPLYQIDPDTYEASVASAKANLAQAEALEASSRLQAKRYAELVKIQAVSQQDYDDAQASWKQYQAQVAAAKASLKSAQIDLNRTRITAPITGRISSSAVTEGALVTASQSDALTTIRQLDPLYVDLTQSSTDLLHLKRLMAEGKLATDKDQQPLVHFTLEDGSAYSQVGKLQFADASVDETTGMVTLRAVVPNPDGLLLPGMFLRASLDEGQRADALLVPQKAVTRTPRGGTSVMVVNGQDQVEPRDIQVSQSIKGSWLVESGLQAGDKVIVAGLQKVKTGAKVAPQEAAATADADKE
ncbi:efflux RND transporter periplasmic adaptor subunit [Pseudaeromonas sp. ZJS20]|uniref:efflux RND transporter periplasmic adaptor subunit n=1 Tax=Pseudaeromonas aegiceratis TaxID=3153928 RepID=UPI00390C5258